MIAVLAIGSAVWLILCCLSLPGWAFACGRLKRRRRREHTVLVLSLPPVPGTVDNPLPADCTDAELEQAVYDRLFWRLPVVVEDLRGAA